MNICILGTGYVGLVTGVVLANQGHYVICVDQNADKVKSLSSGNPCIYEPGLEPLMNKALKSHTIRFTQDLSHGVKSSDIIFICVGTPQNEDGSVDMTQYQEVLTDVIHALNEPKIIVNKSTVPVGTAKWAQDYIKQIRPGMPCEVVSNPEFLQEGRALQNTLHPDRIIIGAKSLSAIMSMTKVYDKIEAPIEVCSVESAELIKYASNSFLATKISFVNWLAQMSEYYGADVTEVTKGMGSDYRIGHEFLNAGIGYGGSCFPKDVSAAIHMSDSAFIDCGILKSVQDVNRYMPKLYMSLLEEELSGLQGRNITVWGLSFKPGTDDTRDSQSIKFINLLLERDANVTAYDPVATIDTGLIKRAKNIYDSADGADAICLLTEWPEFINANTSDVFEQMRNPVFLDARNVMDSEKLKQQGWTYLSLGRLH
jgi:UDPglucose 6-dehydrogenase